MSTIKTFLFDIGGVLSHDGHETYLAHPLHGIALDLGLSEKELFSRTVAVFRKYAVIPTADETNATVALDNLTVSSSQIATINL